MYLLTVSYFLKIREKTYPASKLDASGMVCIHKIPKSSMRSSIKEEAKAIESQSWQITTCKIYLKTILFHTKAVDEIIVDALNRISYGRAQQKKAIHTDNWREMKIDSDKYPWKYKQWSLPSSWYYFLKFRFVSECTDALVTISNRKFGFLKDWQMVES
jgi:hypothetical protein